MALDVLISVSGTVSIGGAVYEFGSLQPARFSVGGTRVRQQQLVIPGGTPGAVVLVWTALVDLPAAYDLLILETDKAIFLELVTDEGNEVGERSYTVELKPGVPLMLGSQRSYANHSPNFAAGTLDLIETIRARKLDATDAMLRMLMVD